MAEDIAKKIAGIEQTESDDAVIVETARQLYRHGLPYFVIAYNRNRFCLWHEHTIYLAQFLSSLDSAGSYSHYRDTVFAGLMKCQMSQNTEEQQLSYLAACRILACQSREFVNDQITHEAVMSLSQKKNFCTVSKVII